MDKEFCTYSQALRLKVLGFDESCFGLYEGGKIGYSWATSNSIVTPIDCRCNSKFVINILTEDCCTAPTFSQAINFLYICSNKQIDIELKASDTYEERLRKIDQGCEDLWNLQNSKSN